MVISHNHLASAAVFLGLMVRIAYWLYVDPIWEDALITLRIISNFVSFYKLSLNPPEVVYGFTSPLHALLVVLPGEFAIPMGGIFTSRVASLIAFVVSVRLALKLAKHPVLNLSRTGFILWLSLLVCYMPGIYFPMGGMETQLVVMAALAAITYCAYKNDLALGIWLGIALLIRPDMIVLFIACLGVRFLGSPSKAVKAGLAACAVYAPWLIFAWVYFGNPIPQTVIAKSLQSSEFSLQPWWFVKKIYSPTTSESLEGSMLVDMVVLLPFVLVLSSFPALYLSVRNTDSTEKSWITLSRNSHLFAAPAFVVGFYLYMTIFVAYCPWYHVPAFMLSGFLFALVIDRISALVPRPKLSACITATLCLSITLPHLAYAAVKPYRDRLVQMWIENGVRIPIGLWLKEHVGNGERVYLEPLGYIGYYSGPRVVIDDWPGLASRSTTSVLRSLPANERSEIDPIPLLKPDWIVIRQSNYRAGIAKQGQPGKELRDQYRIAKEFGISNLAPSYFFLQNNMDAFFYILKRV